ncbi:hypothetical protein HNQ08_000214 [Deinococcus humi]|uniref:Uncharacterized protein n=1 Tax=Deinococcus humi TaxID=662880 RepID=A0A7W8JSF7_9DEIO|nr:hypothetical protein [Deinococcus humi]
MITGAALLQLKLLSDELIWSLAPPHPNLAFELPGHNCASIALIMIPARLLANGIPRTSTSKNMPPVERRHTQSCEARQKFKP